MKKAAIILSGCGFKDGTEITEAVCSMIALSENSASTKHCTIRKAAHCFSFQFHVLQNNLIFEILISCCCTALHMQSAVAALQIYSAVFCGNTNCQS